jgi:hypothetical protein
MEMVFRHPSVGGSEQAASPHSGNTNTSRRPSPLSPRRQTWSQQQQPQSSTGRAPPEASEGSVERAEWSTALSSQEPSPRSPRSGVANAKPPRPLALTDLSAEAREETPGSEEEEGLTPGLTPRFFGELSAKETRRSSQRNFLFDGSAEERALERRVGASPQKPKLSVQKDAVAGTAEMFTAERPRERERQYTTCVGNVPCDAACGFHGGPQWRLAHSAGLVGRHSMTTCRTRAVWMCTRCDLCGSRFQYQPLGG